VKKNFALFKRKFFGSSPVTAQRRFAVAICLNVVKRRAAGSSSQTRGGNPPAERDVENEKKKILKNYRPHLRVLCRVKIVESRRRRRRSHLSMLSGRDAIIGNRHQRPIGLIPAESVLWRSVCSKRACGQVQRKNLAQVPLVKKPGRY